MSFRCHYVDAAFLRHCFSLPDAISRHAMPRFIAERPPSLSTTPCRVFAIADFHIAFQPFSLPCWLISLTLSLLLSPLIPLIRSAHAVIPELYAILALLCHFSDSAAFFDAA